MNFSVALWFVKLGRAVVYLGVCWCNGIVRLHMMGNLLYISCYGKPKLSCLWVTNPLHQTPVRISM